MMSILRFMKMEMNQFVKVNGITNTFRQYNNKNNLLDLSRNFSKLSERAQRRKRLRELKKTMDKKEIPLLKDSLRKLYLRTHPDLFQQYPNEKKINEESYKELMGVLNTIENTYNIHNTEDNEPEYPTAQTLKLPFYLKTDVPGKFKRVTLNLRTSGGPCETVVQESLGNFFITCGIPPLFKWNSGSWGKY